MSDVRGLDAPRTTPLTDVEKLCSGEAYKYFDVGDVIEIPMRSYGDQLFDVVGKNADGNNTITLANKELFLLTQWHTSNVNKYETCALRELLNKDIFMQFDSEVQSAIKVVPKVCHNKSTAVTLTDKVWPFSYTEVGFSGNSYAPAEGTNYNFWKSNADRIKRYEGSATRWWLRTPYTNSDTGSWYVYTDGSSSNYNCSNSNGVVFGLVF